MGTEAIPFNDDGVGPVSVLVRNVDSVRVISAVKLGDFTVVGGMNAPYAKGISGRREQSHTLPQRFLRTPDSAGDPGPGPRRRAVAIDVIGSRVSRETPD